MIFGKMLSWEFSATWVCAKVIQKTKIVCMGADIADMLLGYTNKTAAFFQLVNKTVSIMVDCRIH
jgi:hypothetical protein